MVNERKAQSLFNELLDGLSDSTKNAYNKQRDVYKNVSLSRDNELYKNVCILSTVIINDMLSKGADIERYMQGLEADLSDNKILIADDIDKLSPGLLELIKDKNNIISRYLEVHNVELRITNDFIDSAIELYAIYFKIDTNNFDIIEEIEILKELTKISTEEVDIKKVVTSANDCINMKNNREYFDYVCAIVIYYLLFIKFVNSGLYYLAIRVIKNKNNNLIRDKKITEIINKVNNGVDNASVLNNISKSVNDISIEELEQLFNSLKTIKEEVV